MYYRLPNKLLTIWITTFLSYQYSVSLELLFWDIIKDNMWKFIDLVY